MGGIATTHKNRKTKVNQTLYYAGNTISLTQVEVDG
jgi:hypothetical protein